MATVFICIGTSRVVPVFSFRWSDKLAGGLTSLGRPVLDLFYPATCPGCGQRAEEGNYWPICPGCATEITLMTVRCCRCCGLPTGPWKVGPRLPGEELILCQECEDRPRAFSQARSATLYSRKGPIREAILALKHSRILSLVTPLARLMVERFRETMTFLPEELVMPVPLHWSRLGQRGFNQADLLGRRFAREVKLSYANTILARIKNTQPQAGNAGQRKKNVSAAFQVRKRERNKLEGKSVLLIDDVMTTGATADECARVLLENSSSSVRVFTLARVL